MMKNDQLRHASGSLLAIAMTFFLLPGMPLPDGVSGGAMVVLAACDGGNLKRMTGGVGSVTCFSTLEVPRAEGGEARDPEPAARTAPATEPATPPADPDPEDPPAEFF